MWSVWGTFLKRVFSGWLYQWVNDTQLDLWGREEEIQVGWATVNINYIPKSWKWGYLNHVGWEHSIMLVVAVNGNTDKNQHGQLSRVKQSLQINTDNVICSGEHTQSPWKSAALCVIAWVIGCCRSFQIYLKYYHCVSFNDSPFRCYVILVNLGEKRAGFIAASPGTG